MEAWDGWKMWVNALIKIWNANFIPEQFTVNAHQALLRGRGREGEEGESWMRHYYSSLQLTCTFKTRTKHYFSLQLTYTFKTRTKDKNCEGSHSVRLLTLCCVNIVLLAHRRISAPWPTACWWRWRHFDLWTTCWPGRLGSRSPRNQYLSASGLYLWYLENQKYYNKIESANRRRTGTVQVLQMNRCSNF